MAAAAPAVRISEAFVPGRFHWAVGVDMTQSPTQLRGRFTRHFPPLGGAMLAVFVTSLAYSLILPVLPALVSRGGETDLAAATGMLMATYTIALVVLSPVWGWLLDRRSARTILMIGVLGQGLFVLALVAPMPLTALYVIRALQGALGAAVVPAVLTLVTRVAPSEQHAAAVARTSRAALLGGLAGPLVGGVLANGTDLRTPLFLATALMLIAVWASARGDGGAVPREDTHPSQGTSAATGTLARLAYAAVVAGLALGAMEVGITVRGREVLGLGAASIGAMFAGCGVVMLIVQTLVFRPGRDPIGLWRLLWPSFVLSAVGLVVLGVARQPWMLSLAVALVAASGGIQLPTISLWIVRNAGRVHGVQLGVRVALGALGQAAGAATAGYAFRSDAPIGWLTTILVGMTLAAAWMFQRSPVPSMASPPSLPLTKVDSDESPMP